LPEIVSFRAINTYPIFPGVMGQMLLNWKKTLVSIEIDPLGTHMSGHHFCMATCMQHFPTTSYYTSLILFFSIRDHFTAFHPLLGDMGAGAHMPLTRDDIR
jgi:hypothetical protein